MLSLVAVGCLLLGGLLGSTTAQTHCADACSGEQVVITDDGTSIMSPNYPDNYPENAECEWLIQAEGPRTQQVVELHVDDFNVEYSSECQWDGLYIYDGATSNSTLLDVLCGNRSQITSLTFTSSGPDMLLQFFSDGSESLSGFSASFQFVDEVVPGCSGQQMITESGETITSPNYPNTYPDDAQCQWLLMAPEGQAVEIHVDDIVLEHTTTCSFDSLTIYDGSTSDSPPLAKLCGNMSQISGDVFTSSGTDMLVVFVSDGAVGKSGFSAHALFIVDTDEGTDSCEDETGSITLGACGVPAIAPNISRIIGGSEATPNSIPWQVSMQFAATRQHFCGGSIISNQWVMTAAHCLDSMEGPDMFVVVIGEHDLSTPGEEEVVTVLDYFIHPDWDSHTVDNDMGLIKLSREIEFRDEVSPICLAEVPALDGTRCTVTGWGQSSLETAETTVFPSLLQQAEVTIVSQDQCRDPEWNGDGVTDNMLCAGVQEGGVGVCFGDSGGPLVCRHEDTWFLHGLVSWGLECAGFQKPGVFTRVRQFISTTNEILGGALFPSRNCGSVEDPMIYTDSSGEVTSSGYNFESNYFDNSRCAWLIQAPFGQNINLHFEDMDVEPHDNCSYDALFIFDGPNTNSNLVGTFCGNTTSDDITSAGNAMLLLFGSDGSVNGRGFRITYSTSSNGTVVEPPTGYCGSPSTAPAFSRIVGGTEAPRGSFPWQVSFQTSSEFHFCGGSVAHKNWVITAAHCFADCAPASCNYEAVVGEHDRTVAEGSERRIAIAEVIIHENYNTNDDLDNDIALVRLAEDFEFNDYVSPVCVPSTRVPDDLTCITTGWGETEGTGNNDILQQVNVPTIDNTVCNRDYYPNKITEQMVCAGYPEGMRDSCQGDSGGPLVCQLHGAWFLHGITSWGYGCAEENQPGVYTRVSALQDWITTNSGGDIVTSA